MGITYNSISSGLLSTNTCLNPSSLYVNNVVTIKEIKAIKKI